MLYWVSPTESFAQNSTNAVSQVWTFPNPALSTVPEPGVIATGSEYAFMRTTDPLDSSKRAFRHQLKSYYPSWAAGWGLSPTWRAEVSAPGGDTGYTVIRGQTYWIAYALKPEADVMNGTSAVSVFDLHAADGTNNGGPSPVSITAGSNTLTVWRSWNTAYMGNSPSRETWNIPASSSEWIYLVIQVNVNWDSSQGPFLRVWQAIGSGALTKVVDRSGPVGYNEAANSTAQKFGLYRWDAWSGDAQQTRTSYTKGLYVFKDLAGSPALNENAMLSLLRSI